MELSPPSHVLISVSQDLKLPWVAASPLELDLTASPDSSQTTRSHPLRSLQMGAFDLAVHVEESLARKQAKKTSPTP